VFQSANEDTSEHAAGGMFRWYERVGRLGAVPVGVHRLANWYDRAGRVGDPAMSPAWTSSAANNPAVP
jgi:hypothetical protein